MVSVRPWQALLSVAISPFVPEMMMGQHRKMTKLQNQPLLPEVASALPLWELVLDLMRQFLTLLQLVERLHCLQCSETRLPLPSGQGLEPRSISMSIFHVGIRWASCSAYDIEYAIFATNSSGRLLRGNQEFFTALCLAECEIHRECRNLLTFRKIMVP